MRYLRLIKYFMLSSAQTDLAYRANFAIGLLNSLLNLAVGVLGLVVLKMLPFDNKSEFQVVLDFPEGTALETSQAASRQIAEYLRRVPELRRRALAD